jgi:hypothetical protein
VPIPNTRLNSIPLLPSSYPGRLASRNSTHHSTTTLSTTTYSNDLLCPFITPRHGSRRKHNLSVVEKACLLIRCLTMNIILLRAYASAGMCLASRCLAVGLYVTILFDVLQVFEKIKQKLLFYAYISKLKETKCFSAYLSKFLKYLNLSQ